MHAVGIYYWAWVRVCTWGEQVHSTVLKCSFLPELKHTTDALDMHVRSVYVLIMPRTFHVRGSPMIDLEIQSKIQPASLRLFRSDKVRILERNFRPMLPVNHYILCTKFRYIGSSITEHVGAIFLHTPLMKRRLNHSYWLLPSWPWLAVPLLLKMPS